MLPNDVLDKIYMKKHSLEITQVLNQLKGLQNNLFTAYNDKPCFYKIKDILYILKYEDNLLDIKNAIKECTNNHEINILQCRKDAAESGLSWLYDDCNMIRTV